MARQIVLVLLALAFCLQSTRALEFLWGSVPVYNGLCPPEGFATVALPAEECKPKSYIMCTNGLAVAVNDCPAPLRFNNTAAICDTPESVPWPVNCPLEPVGRITPPQRCGEGPIYLPAPDSCKKYYWCQPSGAQIEMTCPALSYFVFESQRCLYITEPYVREFPPDLLQYCLENHPYTTAAPTIAPGFQ